MQIKNGVIIIAWCFTPSQPQKWREQGKKAGRKKKRGKKGNSFDVSHKHRGCNAKKRERWQFCVDQKHRRRSEEKTEKGDSSVWVKNTEGVAKKRQRKATVLTWVKNAERGKAAQEKGEGQLTSSPTFSFWWKSNSWQFFISESSRRFNSFMASCPHTHTRTASTDVTSCDIICTFLWL